MRTESNEDGYFSDYTGDAYDAPEESLSTFATEAKVSQDGGETWTRRMIQLGGDLEGSGLSTGEIFQYNGEKFKVLEGDDGLRIEPLRKLVEKRVRRKC